ncbi:hypothetical protein BDW62DRAFT_24876 [Aspergillus aurantiobrunneus]
MTLDVPDGTPDRGEGIAILCIVLIAFTTLVTVVRIVSKFITHQYWWWDDLFAVLALLFEIILCSLILAWRGVGLGYHADIVAANNPEHLITGAKYLYIAIFFFDGSVCFPKISALFFYARIFRSNNRVFKTQLWLAGALTTGWLLSAWISTLLECRPFAKIWIPTLPGTCIDTYTWYLATAILSSLIDLYILLLPVPLIWALQASLRRRIYVLITFFMTYSVIVLSICRIVAIFRVVPATAKDLTWEMPLYLYWVILEVSISIISISVPSSLALVNAIVRRHRNTTSPSIDSRSRAAKHHVDSESGFIKNSTTSTQSGNERDRQSRMLADGDFSYTRSTRGEDIPLGSIRVRTDIRVDSGKKQNA